MNKNTLKHLCLAAVGTLGIVFGPAASAASGEEPLWNSFRVGAYYITYDVTADDISGPFVPPGTNLKLKDTVTPYFAYIRRLSTHFATELAFGVPPLTKTVGKGPDKLGSVPYNGQTIATARWFAPTLLLTYAFFDDDTPVRPYIGAGINYTRFYSRQTTPAGDAVTGGPTSISLPTSVGPAGTIGVSWKVVRHFSVNFSLSASEVDSTFTTNTDGVIRRSHISFSPRAAVLSAGYNW